MRLKRVSASSIREFLLCKRKWYQSYILGPRPEPTKALQDGIAVHGEIEHYSRTAEIRETEWKSRVEAVIPHLPTAPFSDAYEIEKWIEMETYEGGPLYVGKIDLIDKSEHTLHVKDYKSSKDLKWMKTSDQLSHDLQMLSYAYYVLTNENYVDYNREQIKLSHYNILIKGTPRVVIQETEVDRSFVLKWWEGLQETIKEMVSWAEQHPERMEELPPTQTACKLFGGCPYRAVCGFDKPFMGLGGALTMATETLMERLQKAAAKAREEISVVSSSVQAIGQVLQPPMIADYQIVPSDAPTRDTPQPETTEEPKKRGRKKADPSVSQNTAILQAVTDIQCILDRLKTLIGGSV